MTKIRWAFGENFCVYGMRNVRRELSCVPCVARVDANGMSHGLTLTGANCPDSRMWQTSRRLIGPSEQVAYRLTTKESSPTTALMLGPIVVHVAALAEGGEVLGPVVRRVVIAVPGGQDYPCGPHPSEDIIGSDRQTDEVPGSVTPGAFLPIPPATIAEMKDALPMGTGANLAPPLRTLEADHS